MRNWMGRTLLLSLLALVGLFSHVALSAGVVAAADSAPPLASDVNRDGEYSPSLLLGESTNWYVFLPLVMQSWPPTPKAPTLQGPDVIPVMTTYTLTWLLPTDSISATLYTVEESSSPDFLASTVYTTTDTTMSFADKSYGRYYYRVQGSNDGHVGPWSNTEAVYLAIFNDSFDGNMLPWAARRTSGPDLSLMPFSYETGGLAVTKVLDRFDFAIFSPLVPAPPTPYRLRLASRIVHKANLVSYGIAWGGSAGEFCQVERAQAADPAGCFSHYYRLNVVWGGTYWKYNVKRVDYHDAVGGDGHGETLVDWTNISGKGWDPEAWHAWEVHVYDNYFEIYVNEQLMNRVYATQYVDEPYYGIFSSTNEYNSAVFEHDYFVVSPLP